MLAGQSDPLFEPARLLMTLTASTEFLAQEELLPKYKERGKALTTKPVTKICNDAGFLTTVEVGQFFMTKRTLKSSHNLQSQWHVVSTLYQEIKNHLTRKVGFDGTPKLGPCQKSQPVSHLQGKYGVEIRIASVNKDNSHSWVRISHGLNKLVTDLIDKEYDDNGQVTSETKTEAFALKMNVVATDQRLKQNHGDPPLLAHLQELYPTEKESGLMLSQKIIRQSLLQCQNN